TSIGAYPFQSPEAVPAIGLLSTTPTAGPPMTSPLSRPLPRSSPAYVPGRVRGQGWAPLVSPLRLARESWLGRRVRSACRVRFVVGEDPPHRDRAEEGGAPREA